MSIIQNEQSTHRTDTAAVVVERIPAWVTSASVDPDGYVLYSRQISEDVEVQQSSFLDVDLEARTVTYRAVDGLQLWIPGLDNSISPEKARELLGHLQELLVVVDEIQAAGE